MRREGWKKRRNEREGGRGREDILQFKGLFFNKVQEICIHSEVKDYIPFD